MDKVMTWIAIAAVGGAVSGCATSTGEHSGHSGFLGDYSKLAPEKDAMGNRCCAT